MGTESLDSKHPSSSRTEGSEEPFKCPSCGQLLDFRCRICVACGEPVEPVQPSSTPLPKISPPPAEENAPKPLVRFPWELSLMLLLISGGVVTVLGYLLGAVTVQFIFQGFQVLCAIWVFNDARHYAIPRPLRWSLGTLFLWVVFLPWYLVRRRRLNYTCFFVETSPYFAWSLVIINLVLALIVIQLLGVGPDDLESH